MPRPRKSALRCGERRLVRLSATSAVLTLLTRAGDGRAVSARSAGAHDPVSAALTPDAGARRAELAALMTERYAPDAAYESTDDNAVRRALDAAARSRRW